MINFTNAQDGGPLMLNAHHIVSIREDRGQVFVLTSTGVEYAVKEDLDWISKRDAWGALFK